MFMYCCLFVCYAITSFFLAKPVVAMIGPKNGLMLGALGYCIYVTGFLLSVLFPYLRYPLFLISCMVGGLAGGVVWTAQGSYFACSAKLYAERQGKVLEDVNASFAGLFATLYLGMEMTTKIIVRSGNCFRPCSVELFCVHIFSSDIFCCSALMLYCRPPLYSSW